MKKALLILFVAVIVISITVTFSLVGCKTTTVEETTAAATEAAAEETTAAAEETTAAATEAAEPITITVWDWQAGSAAYDSALSEINALYTQMNPNVTIDRKAYTTTEYGELIKTAIQSNTLPDLFGLYQGVSMQEVADTGILFEWNDAIEADPEWKANLGKNFGIGGTLDHKTGKIIATAYDLFYITTFGYKNVLEAMGSSKEEVLGLKTYKELADLCQKFKADGHETWDLAAGLQAKHQLQEMFYSWVFSVTQDFNTVYEAETGKRSWTEEPFILAAQAIQDTNKMVREDVGALEAQTDAYAIWLNQEAWGSWYNGPWATGILLDNQTALTNNFSFFKPPIAEGALANCWPADAGQVLSMAKDNPKKDQILEYAKFLATPEVSAIFIKYLVHPFGKFPDNWKDVVPADARDLYANMVEQYEASEIGPWIIYTPDINVAVLDNLSLIFKEQLTPEEGMKKLDEATKAYWAAQ